MESSQKYGDTARSGVGDRWDERLAGVTAMNAIPPATILGALASRCKGKHYTLQIIYNAFFSRL